MKFISYFFLVVVCFLRVQAASSCELLSVGTDFPPAKKRKIGDVICDDPQMSAPLLQADSLKDQALLSTTQGGLEGLTDRALFLPQMPEDSAKGDGDVLCAEENFFDFSPTPLTQEHMGSDVASSFGQEDLWREVGVLLDSPQEIMPKTLSQGTEEISEKPLEILVADVMFREGTKSFKQCLHSEELSCRAEVVSGEISERRLKGIFWAVKAICYAGRCTLTEPLSEFAKFLRQQGRKEEDTAQDKIRDFEKHYGQSLSAKLKLAAESYFYMEPKVFAKLVKMRIPCSGARSGGKTQALQELKRTCVEEDPSLESFFDLAYKNNQAQDLQRKVMQMTHDKSSGSLEEFFPFFGKYNISTLVVFRRLLNVAMMNKIQMGFDGKNTVCFSKRESADCVNRVPMEVMMAAHCLGMKCFPWNIELLAHALYTAGYPLTSYEHFLDVFDVVCVVCGVSVYQGGGQGSAIMRSQTVWKSIKGSSQDVQEAQLAKGFSVDGEKLNLKEQDLVLKVIRFNVDVLKPWGVDLLDQDTKLPLECRNVKEKLLVRVLQEYAKHKEGCPCHILNIFLSEDNDAAKILATVMHVVLRENLNITYDKKRAMYTLHEGMNERAEPETSVKIFVAGKISRKESSGSAELIYDLYDAGYRLSYQKSNDLYQVLSVLYAPDPESVIERCQEFFSFALSQRTLGKGDYQRLFRFFNKKHKALGFADAIFAESLLRLYDEDFITQEEINHILGFTPKSQDATSSALKPKAEDDDKDFLSIVEKAKISKQPIWYGSLIPCTVGAPSPYGVLAFVLDKALQEKCYFSYDYDKQTYRFYKRRKTQDVPHPKESIASFIERHYKNSVCTSKELLESAYSLYAQGWHYGSMNHYKKTFGVACVAHNISVCGIDYISRSQALLRYMRAQKSSTPFEVAVERYRGLGNVCKDEDVHIVKQAMILLARRDKQ